MSRSERNKKPGRGARDAADAALQLTLPLFDPGARFDTTPPGGRSVQLHGQHVHYQVRRSRRRTIGFVIDDRGLSITSPHWVPLAEIEKALHDKGQWIVRKLANGASTAPGASGCAYAGRTVPRCPSSARRCASASTPRCARRRAATAPNCASRCRRRPAAKQLKDTVQAWLQARARTVRRASIDVFAARLGSRPSRWGLSSARTRWGSCGPDGAIRLNWRLVHFPRDIVDYVVAHELAHLRELNHGPRFWRTVGDLFPEFRRPGWLRSYPDDVSIS